VSSDGEQAHTGTHIKFPYCNILSPSYCSAEWFDRGVRPKFTHSGKVAFFTQARLFPQGKIQQQA
jgi:hypothetical protein